jgi:hypothetical protein
LEGEGPPPRAVIGFEEIDLSDATVAAADERLAKVEAP